MSKTIDNDRFDRQARTFGKESTAKISTTKVGIYNLKQSFAGEVAKNLAISGFTQFYLFDSANIDSDDIKYGFCYSNSNETMTRYQVLKDMIRELNPTASVFQGDDSNLNDIDIMILLNQSFEDMINFEKEYHGKLIAGFCTGVNGFVFTNPIQHITNNVDGENVSSHNIRSITFKQEEKESCAVIDTITKHNLSFGDEIIFKNMTLKGNFEFEDAYPVKVINVYKFSIPISGEFEFINGSIEKTQPVVVFDKYKSFEEIVANPVFEGFDHEASNKVFQSYQHIMKYLQNQFMPVISVIGGLVSNEVIKLASEKFTPINQILTFEDSSLEKITSDGEISQDLYNLISENNFAMVGCGAIGCELLKNLVMVGAGSNGYIRVTDPDHIEKSNLSRQFLFRNSHVGQSKSRTAAMMVQNFRKTNIETFENKITPEDETFVNMFLSEINIIFNALDNVEARKYVDSLAFKLGLPLYDGGTNGMKGNTQSVIPKVTETYSDSSDPPDEDSFPICTIKNFPNMIQHTIHHARDNFEDFNRGPTNVNMYLNNPSYLDSLTGIEKNTAIKDINLYGKNFKTWLECAEFTINTWYTNFNHSIRQLLHSFPEDKLTEDGSLFWSKGKRCPVPLEFDVNNEYHVNYLISMTRILCNICGIDINSVTDENILESYSSFTIKDFNVDPDKKAAKTDAEMKNQETEDKEISIEKDLIFNDNYYPQEFEKDDDSNYHIMFITASSNCRAQNYGIPPADFDETKGIAGKIIPAVATTTAIVAGLAVLEMIKFVAKVESIEDYKSYFLNLAINTFIGGEPMPARMIKIGDVEYNAWTKFEQTDDISLGMFIEKWSKVFGTEINMICGGSKIIFSDFTRSDKSAKLSKIISERFKIDPFNSIEEWMISSDEFEDLPSINLVLKKDETVTLSEL